MTPSAIRQLEAAGFTSTQADALDYAIDRRLHDDTDRFAMKSDLAVLATKDELHATKDELKNEIHATKDKLQDKLQGEIHASKNELRGEIQTSRNELWSHTRWIIGTMLLGGGLGIGLIGLLVRGG